MRFYFPSLPYFQGQYSVGQKLKAGLLTLAGGTIGAAAYLSGAALWGWSRGENSDPSETTLAGTNSDPATALVPFSSTTSKSLSCIPDPNGAYSRVLDNYCPPGYRPNSSSPEAQNQAIARSATLADEPKVRHLRAPEIREVGTILRGDFDRAVRNRLLDAFEKDLNRQSAKSGRRLKEVVQTIPSSVKLISHPITLAMNGTTVVTPSEVTALVDGVPAANATVPVTYRVINTQDCYFRYFNGTVPVSSVPISSFSDSDLQAGHIQLVGQSTSVAPTYTLQAQAQIDDGTLVKSTRVKGVSNLEDWAQGNTWELSSQFSTSTTAYFTGVPAVAFIPDSMIRSFNYGTYNGTAVIAIATVPPKTPSDAVFYFMAQGRLISFRDRVLSNAGLANYYFINDDSAKFSLGIASNPYGDKPELIIAGYTDTSYNPVRIDIPLWENGRPGLGGTSGWNTIIEIPGMYCLLTASNGNQIHCYSEYSGAEIGNGQSLGGTSFYRDFPTASLNPSQDKAAICIHNASLSQCMICDISLSIGMVCSRPPFEVSEITMAINPSVVWLKNSIVVAWLDNRYDNYMPFFRIFDTTGLPITGDFCTVNPIQVPLGVDASSVQVLKLGEIDRGGFAILWMSPETQGSPCNNLYVKFYADNGMALIDNPRSLAVATTTTTGGKSTASSFYGYSVSTQNYDLVIALSVQRATGSYVDLWGLLLKYELALTVSNQCVVNLGQVFDPSTCLKVIDPNCGARMPGTCSQQLSIQYPCGTHDSSLPSVYNYRQVGTPLTTVVYSDITSGFIRVSVGNCGTPSDPLTFSPKYSAYGSYDYSAPTSTRWAPIYVAPSTFKIQMQSFTLYEGVPVEFDDLLSAATGNDQLDPKINYQVANLTGAKVLVAGTESLSFSEAELQEGQVTFNAASINGTMPSGQIYATLTSPITPSLTITSPTIGFSITGFFRAAILQPFSTIPVPWGFGWVPLTAGASISNPDGSPATTYAAAEVSFITRPDPGTELGYTGSMQGVTLKSTANGGVKIAGNVTVPQIQSFSVQDLSDNPPNATYTSFDVKIRVTNQAGGVAIGDILAILSTLGAPPALSFAGANTTVIPFTKEGPPIYPGSSIQIFYGKNMQGASVVCSNCNTDYGDTLNCGAGTSAIRVTRMPTKLECNAVGLASPGDYQAWMRNVSYSNPVHFPLAGAYTREVSYIGAGQCKRACESTIQALVPIVFINDLPFIASSVRNYAATVDEKGVIIDSNLLIRKPDGDLSQIAFIFGDAYTQGQDYMHLDPSYILPAGVTAAFDNATGQFVIAASPPISSAQMQDIAQHVMFYKSTTSSNYVQARVPISIVVTDYLGATATASIQIEAMQPMVSTIITWGTLGTAASVIFTMIARALALRSLREKDRIATAILQKSQISLGLGGFADYETGDGQDFHDFVTDMITTAGMTRGDVKDSRIERFAQVANLIIRHFADHEKGRDNGLPSSRWFWTEMARKRKLPNEFYNNFRDAILGFIRSKQDVVKLYVLEDMLFDGSSGERRKEVGAANTPGTVSIKGKTTITIYPHDDAPCLISIEQALKWNLDIPINMQKDIKTPSVTSRFSSFPVGHRQQQGTETYQRGAVRRKDGTGPSAALEGDVEMEAIGAAPRASVGKAVSLTGNTLPQAALKVGNGFSFATTMASTDGFGSPLGGRQNVGSAATTQIERSVAPDIRSSVFGQGQMFQQNPLYITR